MRLRKFVTDGFKPGVPNADYLVRVMELEPTAELRSPAADGETRPKADPLRTAFSVNGLAELVGRRLEELGRVLV